MPGGVRVTVGHLEGATMDNGKEAADDVADTEHDSQAGRPSQPEAPPLPEAASDAIALKLRASYAELVNAPIPDRFSKLLDELSKASKQS